MKDPKTIVRSAVLTGSVEAAATRQVRALAPWVKRILEAAGHPEAWVSDESRVTDLSTGPTTPFFKRMGQKLGIPVKNETIAALARRLRQSQEPS